MDNNTLITKLFEKIDTLDGRIDNIDKTLIKQHAQLEHHIERTNLAEANIQLLRQDVKPIQKHVAMLEGALKLVGIIAIILGAVATFLKLIE